MIVVGAIQDMTPIELNQTKNSDVLISEHFHTFASTVRKASAQNLVQYGQFMGQNMPDFVILPTQSSAIFK